MSYKIGVPRALLYHYFFPAWEKFFQEMGMKVVLSSQTNKKILDNGVKLAVDDLCLPFKVYYGHVLELIDRVDYLFVPRLISLGKNNSVCPKFMGLPDMVRATFANMSTMLYKLPQLIEPEVDLRRGRFPLRRIAHEIGSQLRVSYWKVERAYWRAVKRQKDFEIIEEKGYTPEESMAILRGKGKKPVKIKENKILKVAVLGHAYLLNDEHISMGIIKNLRQMGIKVFTLEMINTAQIEEAALLQPKKSFWYFNRHVMGGAYFFLSNHEEKVDGIIQVTAFGCGPDSLIKELVDLKGKNNKDVSILNINLDEHSGQAGLITRLEAFVDLLERRKMV